MGRFSGRGGLGFTDHAMGPRVNRVQHSLTIVHRDDTLVLGAAGPLHIAGWLDAPGTAQIARLSELADQQRRRYGEHSAFANLIASGTPRFSPEVRQAVTALTKRSGGAGAAHVVLLDGLPGVAVRSFLSTILLLARPKVATRVFGDLDEAAVFLAAALRENESSWTHAEVLRLLEHARAELQPGQAASRNIAKIRTPVTDT